MDLQALFEKYLTLSYRYLSIRNRSETEIREYLGKKNAAQEIIDKIVTRLKEKKFLNDEEFARSFVLNRARLKPKGKKLLTLELRQKGIAEDLIKKVLDEVRGEIPDELSQAKSLIVKKMQKMVGMPKQEIYQKVGGFLARRGYSWDVVKKAIDFYL